MLNIYQKLLEVKKSVVYLQKEASGAQFKYTPSSQVLGAVRDKMNEVGLLLIPEIVGQQVSFKEEPKSDGKKTITYMTEINMKMTWVNTEKIEEKIECQWYAQGVDIAGEKGVGKALTYAEKYFILKTFNIPTDKDDPDSFQKKIETAKKSQPDPLNGMSEEIKTLFKGKFVEGKKMTKGQVDVFCERYKFDWTEILRNLKNESNNGETQ